LHRTGSGTGAGASTGSTAGSATGAGAGSGAGAGAGAGEVLTTFFLEAVFFTGAFFGALALALVGAGLGVEGLELLEFLAGIFIYQCIMFFYLLSTARYLFIYSIIIIFLSIFIIYNAN